MHLEVELLKWLMLFALAGALVFVAASTAVGATTKDALPPPGVLPDAIHELARPMSDASPNPVLMSPDEFDPSMMVWEAIGSLHDDPEQALGVWNDVPLPCESEVWRQVALGASHLRMVDAERAAEALDIAAQLEPDNAVVHYYTGILRLVQAAQAHQWYDAIGPVDTRYVAYRPFDVVPNSKSMYELAAMMELERAIELAPYVPMTQPLVPEQWSATNPNAPPVVSATVGDLLAALRADNFEAKSHNVLGQMFLDRGSFEQSEQHWDAAAALGLSIAYGYDDLGEEYEAAGRHGDAIRAYMKSMPQRGRIVGPVQKVVKNLRDAFIDMW